MTDAPAGPAFKKRIEWRSKDRNATIEVYGSWNRFEKPTVLQYEGRGVFACEIEVPEGEHYYRFLVDDDWETDDSVSKTVKLGNEYNTLLAGDEEHEDDEPDEAAAAATAAKPSPAGVDEVGGESIVYDSVTRSFKVSKSTKAAAASSSGRSRRKQRHRPSMEIQLTTDFLSATQQQEEDDIEEEPKEATEAGESGRSKSKERRRKRRKKKKKRKPRSRPFDFSGDVDLAEAFKQKEEEWARMCFVQQLRQQQAHNDEINRVKTLWKQERQVRVEMHKKVMASKDKLQKDLNSTRAEFEKLRRSNELQDDALGRKVKELSSERDSLQQRVKDMLGQQEKLSNELSDARGAQGVAASETNKRALELQSKLSTAEDSLRDTKSELDRLALQNKALNKSIADMRESHKRALELEAERARAAASDGAEDLAQISTLKTEKGALEAELQESRRALDKEKDRASELERSLGSKNEVEERLRKQIKDLQDDTSAAQENTGKELESLKAELEKREAALNDEKERANSRVASMESRIEELRGEQERALSGLRKDHEDAMSALSAKSGADVTKQVGEMQSKLESRDKDIASKSEEIMSLKSKLEESETTNAATRRDFEAAAADAEKFRQQSEGLSSELSDAKRGASDLQHELTTLQDKFKETSETQEAKMANLEKELASMSEDRSGTMGKLSAAEEEIASLTGKLNEAREASSNKDREIMSISESLNSVKSELNEKNASVQAYEGQVADLQKAIKDAKQAAADQAEELTAKVEELTRENNRILDEKRAAVADKQKELDALKAEYSEKKAMFDEVEFHLKKLQGEFEIEKNRWDNERDQLTMKVQAALEKDEKIIACCKTLFKEFQNVRIAMEQVRSKKIDELDKMNEFFPNFQELLNKTLNFNAKLVKDTMEKYKRELSLRRKYFNIVQELRGNIRVFCRVRPLLPFELKKGAKSCLTFPVDEDFVLKVRNHDELSTFEYDRVYKPNIPQEAVSEDTTEYIQSVMDGYNVSIFAYGQTGSGKTYTMDGPPDNPGVNLRALEELFRIVEERTPMFEYNISTSVYEIYNDKVLCLLTPAKEAKKKDFKVRQNPDGTVYVQNAKTIEVKCKKDVTDMIAVAKSNRKTASTKMNSESSRSHMLLEVSVRGFNVPANIEYLGKLFLVDLAGSERVAKSGATGARLKEAAEINKSLTALGDVMQSLQKKQKFIPYRNSTLTYLMQNSLGGHAKTVMFINICPTAQHVGETLSSLKFAQRVAKVELGQAKKTIQKVSKKISKLEKKQRAGKR